MSQDMNEATRVMSASVPPGDKTMVVPGAAASGFDRTMVAGAPPMAGATQMGVSVVCAVCKTSNSGMETYCSECGFLLSATPGQAAEEPAGGGFDAELIDSASGRRFKLKPGPNSVGRENCDILLMDGTISRRHALLTIENGAVMVTDLGSTNGTKVEGVRISPNQPTWAATGTLLQFGSATLTLTTNGAPADATIVSGSLPTVPLAEPTLAVQVDAPPDALTEQTLLAGTPLPLAPEQAHPGIIATPPPSDKEPILIARLVSVAGNAPEIAVLEGVTSVGRRTGNTVVINTDPYVSGRHAEILSDASGCHLTDVGSTNGTLVNGQRLAANAPQLLLDGDSVTFGQTEYTFETLDVPEEPAPTPQTSGESEAQGTAVLPHPQEHAEHQEGGQA